MLVKDAKTKVCPFITDNRGFYDGVPTMCICGDCMAWGYTTEHDVKYIDEDKGIALKDDGYVYNLTHQDAWSKELEENEKHGICRRIEQ